MSEEVQRRSSAISTSQGIANAVPVPKKNPYLLRIATCYAHIPMGFREFVLAGPLLLLALGIAYFAPTLAPMDKLTQGLQPNTAPMSSYRLEPIHNEKGELKGYRRIFIKQDKEAKTSHES
ncbi:hypothetical protein, conserved [Trypanosoma brucei gambiense DAL972]|uniref:Uncharacterized protein n=2 Tax=Trypanosoma brucei TaxID=5691 RepID=D0A085_TRYB9|nr:hypothetical protein, conserved [Trypanosoma brucei gambiense DAL972]RHW69861.1 hypothetical protein DPX39_100150900 [Trypanosoma brucei equiperdum]CBH16643.1 hypothetical protein, conserved [Trypanosoma brucei gambiense DAL972]|eukprot:XP_011778907.1 hypothetical protein, conserved [Trypanosoma brucei gambiense DAL972]